MALIASDFEIICYDGNNVIFIGVDMGEAAIRLIIGTNIRMRRRERRMSQEILGEKINVSYQQVQKYECGENSIKSEKLVLLAKVFDCSVNDLCK